MKHTKICRLGVVCLAVGLIAAACGSNDESADSGTEDSAEVETAAGDDSDDAENQSASGEPILLRSILDESEATGQFFPFSHAALEAAELYINENGGLGGSGRPVNIEVCVGEIDANVNEECGRDAVADGAVAVVGSAICTNDTAYPPLNEAGIPNIGPLSCLQSTWASPNTFIMGHGFQGTAALQAILACNILEADNTVLTGVNIPSVVGSVPVYNQVLEASGCDQLAGEPFTELDTSDFAPIAAQWADADVVLFSNAPPQSAPLIKAALAAEIDATLVFTPPTMSSATLAATEGESEGVMAIRYYRAPDDSIEGYKIYRDYLARVDGEQYIADEFGTAAWVSVLALDHALRNCADCELTAAGALEAMSGLAGFDALGIAPTIDFTVDPPAQFAEMFPRIPTAQGFAGIVVDGTMTGFNNSEPIG